MQEYIGHNAIKNLEGILKKNSFRNIFLITGRNSFKNSKIKEVIYNSLKGFKFLRFNDFTPNPKLSDIKKGLNLFKDEPFDAIVAVGGGSVIDMAKSISIFSTNEGNPEDFILKKKKIKNHGIPLIRIPTTSGSGSEATHFAVVYIEKNKYSLTHPELMQPEYVILDPQLTYELPKSITAYSGMDALTQAIESFWNIHSTQKSKQFSRKAIDLVIENLSKAVKSPDKVSRLNMALAANFAGKAINLTKTTACHAISYPMTSYFNIPHGQAVSLTLPPMLEFNYSVSEENCLDTRGVKFVKKSMMELFSIIGASDSLESREIITQLMKNVELETKLSDLGIKNEQDIDLIIKHGFNLERVKNNPRKITEYQLRKMLEDIK